LKAVGERLGLSLVRIKQIEAEALKKIQKKENFLKIK
jgi:DNA-directed RNA polymerase sigma subunit (sigma70/sigma32)